MHYIEIDIIPHHMRIMSKDGVVQEGLFQILDTLTGDTIRKL